MMPFHQSIACLCSGFIVAAAAPAQAQSARSGLSAFDVLAVADQAREAGRMKEASTLYDAVAKDPNLEIRTEARFRKGMMLAALGRYREAAETFRRLLDEKPDAVRVRLELARVLAAMDDTAGARKAVRQAQAAGLPPEVAATVDQFANALRSRKRYGGSLQLALAPDSNINRATSAKTLDTVIAPLTLDEEAQARSGLGAKVGGQAYARQFLRPGVNLLAQASVSASLYRQDQFNDISASVLAGPEIQAGAQRWRPAIGVTRRFYGRTLYASTSTARVDWMRPLGPRTQLDAQASLSSASYRLNHLQDGEIGDLGASVQHAFNPRTGGSLSLAAARQTARDKGYATTSGGVSALIWRDIGSQTLFASIGVNALRADARLFPFTAARDEQLYRVMAGATFRGLTVRSFAPAVRVTHETNRSTVSLYDYSRTSVELGIERAF